MLHTIRFKSEDLCEAGTQKSKPNSLNLSTGRMTNQPTANQSNTKKEKEKEETSRDDNTELAYKDAGHCSRNTHNLLLGLTVLGTHGHEGSGCSTKFYCVIVQETSLSLYFPNLVYCLFAQTQF